MYAPATLREDAKQVISEISRSSTTSECQKLLKQAIIALGEGTFPSCLAALEAVQIQLPSDSLVTLAIGILRILAGDPRATEPLELVASRHDDRKTMLYLILARMTFGATHHAAADLGTLLQKHAPSFSEDAIALYNHVTREGGARGWCGLSSTGVLVVGLAEKTRRANDITVLRDGVQIPVTLRKDPRSALYYVGAIEGWLNAHTIDVSRGGRPLIGSPIDVARITRMEGFVEANAGGISGWCWFPSDPDRVPSVSAVSRSNGAQRLAIDVVPEQQPGGAATSLAAPWRFAAGREQLSKIRGLADILGPGAGPCMAAP